jgi:hypothetical protein
MSEIPTQKVIYNDDLEVDQRIRLELAYVYATLHGGGPTEAEKAKNVYDFVQKMFPFVKDGSAVT